MKWSEVRVFAWKLARRGPRRLLVSIICMALFAVWILDGEVSARTIRVPEDFKVLPAAVEAASDGDEIILNTSQDTYRWGQYKVAYLGYLEIVDKSLHIRGGGPDKTAINASFHGTRIVVKGQSNVVFEGVAILGDYGTRRDPQIVVSGNASLTLRNVAMVNAQIILREEATCRLLSCTIKDNYDFGVPCIEAADKAALSLENCKVESTASCLRMHDDSDSLAKQCHFVTTANESWDECISIFGNGRAVFEDCSLETASSGVRGGAYLELRGTSISCDPEDGVCIGGAKEIVVENCEFSSCLTAIHVRITGAQLRISETTIEQPSGVGLLLEDGEAVLSKCEIDGAGEAGVMLEGRAMAMITGCTITNGVGWGIIARDSAVCVGWDNTVAGNQRGLANVSHHLVESKPPETQEIIRVPEQVENIQDAIYRIIEGGTVVVNQPLTEPASPARAAIYKAVHIEGENAEAVIGGLSIYQNLGDISIRGLSVVGDKTGIGIVVGTGTHLALHDATISDWSTGLDFLSGSSALVQQCVLTRNGTAISDSSSSLQIKTSDITSNGTGLHSSSGDLSIDDCSFTHNGTAIEIDFGVGSASITDSAIEMNAEGIYTSCSQCDISRCSIVGNEGIGIQGSNAELSIDESTIQGSEVGIYLHCGGLSLTKTQIFDNKYGVHLGDEWECVEHISGEDLCIMNNSSANLFPIPAQYPWPEAFEKCSYSPGIVTQPLVQDFAVSGVEGAGDDLALAWTNPGDASLEEVRVCRKTVGWPENHADGLTVYAAEDPVPNSRIDLVDSGLAVGQKYYYVVFCRNAAGDWNDAVHEGENAALTALEQTLSDQPPNCRVQLIDQQTGQEVSEFVIGQQFDISLEGSEDDQGIEGARFCSDEAEDGQPTGDWTGWYVWATSEDDWDSATKTKTWSFATPGDKEIWVQVRDASGNMSQCSIATYAHPGYAIVVAGQGGWPDKRGIDHAANNAYRALRNLGFDDNHVVYLNSDTPQDVDNDADDDVDGEASLYAFKDAIHKVAQTVEGSSTPVLIYLVGHGEQDCFIFDENDSENGYLWVSKIPGTPGLAELLSEFTESVPCAIMIGSCYSGCFIASSKASPGSISAPDRVVITLAHNDKDRAMVGVVRSSDTLWGDLMDGASLRTAFKNRSLPGDTSHLWLDDNGDEIGHPPNSLEDDGNVASRFRIGVPGSDDLKLKSWVFFWLRSPGELRVYDAEGRITGIVNGEVSEEIPDSLVDTENNIVALFSMPESHHCEVIGTGEGSYNLDCVYVADGKDSVVSAVEVPTVRGAIHSYTVDWTVAAQGGEGMTLQVDAQGDGEFEKGFINASCCPIISVATGNRRVQCALTNSPS